MEPDQTDTTAQRWKARQLPHKRRTVPAKKLLRVWHMISFTSCQYCCTIQPIQITFCTQNSNQHCGNGVTTVASNTTEMVLLPSLSFPVTEERPTPHYGAHGAATGRGQPLRRVAAFRLDPRAKLALALSADTCLHLSSLLSVSYS